MSHSINMDIFDEAEGCHVPVRLPAHYEVCPRCKGKGSVCNLGAMTGDEYREALDGDPDFPEHYARGLYDVPCPECGGERVVSAIDMDALDAVTRVRVEAELDALAESAAQERYQQRYGF